MQGINKTVAIGAALLLAVAAYAYGWHRGDSGQQPDLATDVSADEEGRKTYYPNTEKLGKNEMRVISLGTGMPNQRKSQASACWLVELGNGDKFLFDLGTGSVSNLSVLEIPYDLVNKVFVGHLHSDHVGDFAAWHIGGWVGGRQKAPRIWGPDAPADHPDWGTKNFVDQQIKSYAWDIATRSGRLPTVAGQIEVTEFPHDEFSVVYDENGVKISAWPAIHIIAGPVSFSLEWKNRKFVFSSDTFPNQWFIEHANGADIVIHETFGTIRQNIDLQGWDRANSALVSSRVHTPPAAAGKVFSMVEPRMAIAYHFFNDENTWQDMYDEIRSTYDGPLTLAKDLLVWNVTDDEIKVREVVAQEAVWPAKSPYGTVPPTGDREELPPWLVDGILEMEDTIKAYYERQGVGDLYEEQVPKKQ
ncbi:MAG: MBL fold metallo-hydrolase [Deltaproteobacteria bacterium]|nr:MBL fold metallo-hydrolase [Deltaproteobacteria bacterium]